MKHAMGQINLFETHHFGFESEHFYALKTKSVRHSVELFFYFKTRSYHISCISHLGGAVTAKPYFVNTAIY